MADGRDNQAMQKKYQDMVSNFDQLDQQFVRKVSPENQKIAVSSKSILTCYFFSGMCIVLLSSYEAVNILSVFCFTSSILVDGVKMAAVLQ